MAAMQVERIGKGRNTVRLREGSDASREGIEAGREGSEAGREGSEAGREDRERETYS